MIDNPEKFQQFRQYVLDEGGSFSVSLQEGAVHIQWGGEHELAVAAPTGGEKTTERGKRMLAMMKLGSLLGIASNEHAAKLALKD